MTIKRLLKSWAIPPGELADRLDLLRVPQGFFHASPLRHLSAELVIRGRKLGRAGLDEGLQLPSGAPLCVKQADALRIDGYAHVLRPELRWSA